MGISPFLLAASIGSAPLHQQAAWPRPAPIALPAARPALWVINDDDTIIYLFGTFHALDGRSNWFDQSVRTALASSDQLMLETLVPKRPAAAARPMAFGNLAPVTPVPPAALVKLMPSASYLATSKMVMSASRARGMSTEFGADAVLREAAEDAGKPVGGLETFDFQLAMFRALPPGGPAGTAPPSDPRSLQQMAALMSQLQAGWGRGDVEQTFAPMLRQMKVQSPATYRTMFVDRNVRWAQWIANRLQSPGTVFVAVGAGHLSGPDSVQNQLSALGVKSARVN